MIPKNTEFKPPFKFSERSEESCDLTECPIVPTLLIFRPIESFERIVACPKVHDPATTSRSDFPTDRKVWKTRGLVGGSRSFRGFMGKLSGGKWSRCSSRISHSWEIGRLGFAFCNCLRVSSQFADLTGGGSIAANAVNAR